MTRMKILFTEFWLDPCLSSLTTCFHHGTCTSSSAISRSSPSQPYLCACTEAYTGSRCEIELPCPSQRCLNNGTCQRNAQFGYFECLCTSDYLGSSCEQGSVFDLHRKKSIILLYVYCFILAIPKTTSISPCALNPCLNGATCSETSVGGFLCICLPNFFGQRCEDQITTTHSILTMTTRLKTVAWTSGSEQHSRTTDVCKDNTCLNAGKCLPNGVGGFLCQCLNGYVGLRCEARGKRDFESI